ncbi:MAG: multifunctional CCA addition/repair protein [Gammaproteobacteria bacterium]|nr:multifunctional CCA addition/repair protein [Gammaproteobacteria bacterium]
MKIYRVGGAVRDRLLGLPTSENDWVVVGASTEHMLSLGYKQVGRDFPVFLHPHSGEEYALARTERKAGRGHVAFDIDANAEVTLEQDLERRDLTINAIAESDSGELIDPFAGQADLAKKILRHVSNAFVEDPLRVLRVARFAARFANLGFHIADDTQSLMTDMTSAGELDSLTPERVWKETELALKTDQPTVFFETLREVGALAVLFPEIDALFGVPQPAEHHPEIDSGVHTLMTLTIAGQLSDDPRVRFATLVHDLGKATTPQSEWPRHITHEQRGVDIIKAMSARLRIPNDYRELGELASRFHLQCHRAFELRPETVVKMFKHTRAFQQRDRFHRLLLVAEADARGRKGHEQDAYPQAEYLCQALATAAAVTSKDIDTDDLDGELIGQHIHQGRVAAVADVKSQLSDNQIKQ